MCLHGMSISGAYMHVTKWIVFYLHVIKSSTFNNDRQFIKASQNLKLDYFWMSAFK